MGKNMKVVHLCLGAFYPDNYSYQENMLPKFHKVLGYDVEVIACQETFDSNGKMTYSDYEGYYQNEYGITVCRVAYQMPRQINHKLKNYKGVYEALQSASPDIIYIHNCQFMDIYKVIKYIRNSSKKIDVYVDNHVDFSNSAHNWFSKNVLHRILWRKCAQSILPYTKKFYGVLPARVDFLVNMYGLPKEKCELLVMGADDEAVAAAEAKKAEGHIRTKFGIAKDDFLIMTGGKIDPWKTQTLLLMKAVAQVKNPKVKLIVFGSIDKALKEEFESLCIADKVIYAGWIQAKDSYDYFAAADLAVFPGRHSVFWEQCAGQGIPMVCKYWDGTTHVDMGGNVKFLTQDSEKEIYSVLNDIISNTELYEKMKKAALINQKVFSYKDIARRSIEG